MIRPTKRAGFAFALALGLTSTATCSICVAQSNDMRFDSGFAVSNNDADNYLKTMKRLIHGFNSTVSTLVLPSSGGTADQASMDQAAARTQKLADEINSVKAPPEMRPAHRMLGQTMGDVQNYLSLGGFSAQGTAKALSLASGVQSTMNGYHRAVLQMIQTRGLDPSLDPFAGEDESSKAQALQQINSLTQAATAGGAAAGGGMSSLNGAMTGGMGGALGGIMGGANPSGGMGDLFNSAGGLGGMGGGNGGMGGSLGGMAGGLGGMAGGLGGMGGGAANGGSNPLAGMDMQSVMKGLQGMMNGMNSLNAEDHPHGAGATTGGANNVDVNALMQSLMGGMGGGMGGLGGSPSTAPTTVDPVGPPDPSMGGMPGPPR